MKYFYIILIICLALASCGQDTKDVLTPDEIWTNHFNLSGGREKLESVKSSSYSMIAKSKNGIETRNLKIQHPDKINFEIITPQGDTSIHILNGEHGITKHNGEFTKLTKWDSLRLSEMVLIFPELHYKRLGYEMIRKADTLINNISYYNVFVNTPNQPMNYLFHKNSFELHYLIWENLSIEFIDNIIIDGIILPKTSKIIIGKDTLNVENRSQKLNVIFDESTFNLSN